MENSEKISELDRKSTRLNSSHGYISYAVFCLKKSLPIQILKRTAQDHVARWLRCSNPEQCFHQLCPLIVYHVCRERVYLCQFLPFFFDFSAPRFHPTFPQTGPFPK